MNIIYLLTNISYDSLEGGSKLTTLNEYKELTYQKHLALCFMAMRSEQYKGVTIRI